MLEDRKVDYFFHLASKDMYYGSTEHVDYAPFVETNVLGTTNAFDLSRHLGVKKFIYVSSHSVYGDIGANLMDEENSVPKPISPNGASKLSAEHVIQFMSNFYKNSAIILRAFSVYGPGMRPQTFIPLVIDRLIKDLPLHSFIEYHNKRDFIYIEDAVRYILLSLKEENQFQIVNIASGNSYSLEQIALKIAKIMNKDPNSIQFKRHTRDFDMVGGINVHASVSKARELFKYAPIVDIDEGLTRTVEWYLKNPDILEVSTHH